MKYFFTLALLFFALPTMAVERARVSAADIAAAASQWLESKAKEEGIPARFALVGHINDVQLNGDVPSSIHVNALKSSWLRPRVGIPVQILVADKAVSTVTVWFSVTAADTGLVYAKNQTKAVLVDQLSVRSGPVDLARTKGKAITSLDAFVGMRLRKTVAENQALQADDFEIVPTIQAQQTVRIETQNGAVRLSSTARALADANIGEMVQVMPTHAAQPVRARVVSEQVVIIEN